MINAEHSPELGAEPNDAAVDAVAGAGARGAIALAGIATAIVLVLWFGFYFLIFVPRATVP